MTEVNIDPKSSVSAASEEAAFIAASASPDATEALAHLKRMSGTGSAFGATEYVAINPTSIASLLLGFATLLSALANLFLFIPIVGVVCGIIAIRQIRNSNGTQSGIGLAAGGILLSLIIGGGIMAHDALAWSATQSHSRQCAQIITKFGEEIKAQHDDVIYNTMTTEMFRSNVDYGAFHGTLDSIRRNSSVGSLVGFRWNGAPMEFQSLGEGNGNIAMTEAVVEFSGNRESLGRQEFRLSDREGTWKIDALPHLFAEKGHRPKPGDSFR